MTATYDKLGLKFLYPESWKLIDDSDGDTFRSITLETPEGNVTWAVHVYPPESDYDLMMKEMLAPLHETYDDLEISPEQSSLGEYSASGIEAMFYCLDFLVRARLQIVTTSEKVFLFWSQAEDRDFDKQQLVFDAISVSLLRSVESANGDG